MTVIRPNSISGITSITAQANEINIFRSDGTLAGLQINGINFNNTSGISTLAALNVTGNVSIAGTLTYEDVTNVDSVGIITARDGIRVTGGEVGIGTNNPDRIFHISTASPIIKLTDTDNSLSAEINGSSGNIYFDTHNNNRDIIFRASTTEVARITGDGKVGINSLAPNSHLDVIASSANRTYTPGSSVVAMFERNGHTRIAIASSATSYGQIDFADTNDDNTGYIRYDHSDNSMSFRTNGSDNRLRITSDGKIGIGTDNPILGLDIMSDDGIFIKTATHNVGAAISFSDAAIEGHDQIGTIEYRHVNDSIIGGTAEGFTIKGTESTMGVKIEGLLKIQSQPCAVVYQCTGPAGGAANSSGDNLEPLHFDHVHINQGGMTISQNNARIQVPVSGIYFVSYMVSGGVTNVDLNDGIELILMRNGSEYPAANSGIEPVFNFGAAANQEEFAASNTILVSLTKDDYIEVALDNIGSSDATINRGNFCVMLMA